MKSLLIFIHNQYQELELWYPKIRMEEANYKTVVAAPEAQKIYESKRGYPCKSDIAFKDVNVEDFSALLIPGGFSPDALRMDPKVLSLTKQFFDEKKMIAFICHGGWVPISAKILKGKQVTGYIAIKDDLENAGAIWKDEPVVIDGNLISSRTPADLHLFAKAMVDYRP
ncbi:MAG: type 1 glutamine amidotransferase [Simkania sp.]|nr:type 1 glutamine amidotransferase [Simkania sp.]